jgi:hypothetical protein
MLARSQDIVSEWSGISTGKKEDELLSVSVLLTTLNDLYATIDFITASIGNLLWYVLCVGLTVQHTKMYIPRFSFGSPSHIYLK